MLNFKSVIAVGMFSFSAFSMAEDTPYSGPMGQHAEKNGITTCLAAIKKIDKFLYEGKGANGVTSTWNTGNSNERGFTSFGTVKYNDGTWGYDSVHISPTKGNTCDGSLTRMITFPHQSCSATREQSYKDWEYQGELAGKAIFGKDGQDLFLEDVSGSCVALRVEPLYGM